MPSAREVALRDDCGVTWRSESAAALLERGRELGELDRALSDAGRGHGRVVVVEASAGLGKTSLLEAASSIAAESGFRCLAARGGELERDFAYGCVRQLLEPVVTRASAGDNDALFAGAAGLCKPLFAQDGVMSATASADRSFSMLHGLYWLVSNLTEQGPVAVCVDDVQWCDSESLRFLVYLSARLDGLAVMLVVAGRPAEVVTADLARLAAAPETVVLRPGPLSVEATAALCERRLGSGVAREFAAACWMATGGNPFFVGVLLSEVQERRLSTDAGGAAGLRGIGPAAVANSVLLRLAGASAEATNLARAIAVLGDGASIREVASLGGLDEGRAAAAADLLIGREILQTAHGLQFAHPIVRQAVYEDIGANERARAHARAAEVLAAAGGSEERIAAQLSGAPPTGDPERVELLRRVAGDALARGAPGAAVAWLARALAEPPSREERPGVLLELGTAELTLGSPEAVDHLAAAVDVTHQPSSLVAAVRPLALALTMTERADRALEALRAAIEVVEGADRELALLLEAELHAYTQQAGLEARAQGARRLSRHGELAGGTPGERLVLACQAFEQARASESASQAAEHIERGLAGGRLLAEQELPVAGPFYHLVLGLLATDALDLADACVEQALAQARKRASIPALAYATLYRGQVALRRGALADVEADARMAVELLASHGIRFASAPARGVLIEALIERGELEDAERTLHDIDLPSGIAPGLTDNILLKGRGLLHLARERTREGLQDLIEFGRHDEHWGVANPLASRWRSHACLALSALGEAEQARGMAADELWRARRWGAASGIGVALRAVALTADGAASIDGLQQAVDVLADSPARLEHARALTDLGAALRRANRRSQARRLLRQGMELAERCAAGPLVARARTELRAAGGRSADPTGIGVARLTASERRVAELAGAGRSNPEIAQALFITRKTVETHLGHVYLKLNIPGRGELGRALADES